MFLSLGKPTCTYMCMPILAWFNCKRIRAYMYMYTDWQQHGCISFSSAFVLANALYIWVFGFIICNLLSFCQGKGSAYRRHLRQERRLPQAVFHLHHGVRPEVSTIWRGSTQVPRLRYRHLGVWGTNTSTSTCSTYDSATMWYECVS